MRVSHRRAIFIVSLLSRNAARSSSTIGCSCHVWRSWVSCGCAIDDSPVNALSEAAEAALVTGYPSLQALCHRRGCAFREEERSYAAYNAMHRGISFGATPSARAMPRGQPCHNPAVQPIPRTVPCGRHHGGRIAGLGGRGLGGIHVRFPHPHRCRSRQDASASPPFPATPLEDGSQSPDAHRCRGPHPALGLEDL